ncbi:MAG: zf-TFIIB domain-containing protein [Phycisphaeraceae bacterium]|nr:MAG: zf-TFIIB domain-containing protein [Phycisphaeraceae bacterium]
MAGPWDLIHDVEPTEDDPVVVNPLNGRAMRKLDIGGVKIDRCESTGAIWLDRGELGQLALLDARYKRVIKAIDVRREDEVPRETRGRIKSPRTGALMLIVHDPDDPSVEFDVCPECGGCFFDSGELAELTEYSFVDRLRVMLGRT